MDPIVKGHSKFKTANYMLNYLTNLQFDKRGEYNYTTEDLVSQRGVPPRSEKTLDLFSLAFIPGSFFLFFFVDSINSRVGELSKLNLHINILRFAWAVEVIRFAWAVEVIAVLLMLPYFIWLIQQLKSYGNNISSTKNGFKYLMKYWNVNYLFSKL